MLVGILLLTAASCAVKNIGSQAMARWRPWTNAVVNPEQLAHALEERWSMEAIRVACQSSSPTPGYVPNLGARTEGWEGDLHKDSLSEFDRLWWYAGILPDGTLLYSVNARKGKRFWIVEIGNQQVLAVPPLPKPKQYWEKGFKEPDY